MEKITFQCNVCKDAVEEGGDWVPYGMGSTQLPTYMVCNSDNPAINWDDPNFNLESLADNGECPYFNPLPKCPEHPEQYIYPKCGCGECMYKAYEEERQC